MSMPREALQEIKDLLAKEGRIGAIQYIRRKYSFSLAEADAIINALESPVADTPPPETSDSSAATNSIRALLADRRKLEAIKYAKEELRISLKEARDLVERLDRTRKPGPSPSGIRVSKAVPMIFLSIFLVVGLAFCGVAIMIYSNQASTIENSDLINGRVINMVYDSDHMSAPVFEYEWNGKVWRHESNSYSNPPAYEIDEVVPIYVNHDDPEDIVVDTFSDRWLLIVIFGIMGGAFVGLPALFAWFIFRGR